MKSERLQTVVNEDLALWVNIEAAREGLSTSTYIRKLILDDYNKKEMETKKDDR